VGEWPFQWRRHRDELDTLAQMGRERERAKQRIARLDRNVVRRHSDLRKTYGWMKPGTIWSMAKAGVDPNSELARRLADASATVRNRTDDWNMPGDPVGRLEPEPAPGTGGRGRFGAPMEPRPAEEEVLSFKEFRRAVLAGGEMEKRTTSGGTRISTSEEREAIQLGREYAENWRSASKEERRAAYDSYVAEVTGKGAGGAKGGGGDTDKKRRAAEIKAKDPKDFTEADKKFIRKIGGELIDKSTFGIGDIDLPDLGKRLITDYNIPAGIVRMGQAVTGGRAIEAPGAFARGMTGIGGRASDVGRERAGKVAQETGVGDPIARAWNETFGRVVKPTTRALAVAANFPYEYGQALFRGPIAQYQEAGFGVRSEEERAELGGPLGLVGQELSETQLGQVGSRLIHGERVDLGSGYLPGVDSDIWEAQAEAARERVNIAGHAVTPGRWLANQIFEPGTGPFDILSGITDGAVAIYGDPTNLIGGGTSRARGLAKTFAAADEGADVAKTLASKNGRAYLDLLAQTSDPASIAKRTSIPADHPVVDRIAAATTPEDVNHILRSTPDLSSAQVIELAGGVDRLRKYQEPLTASEWLASPPVQALNEQIAASTSPSAIRRMLGPSFRGQTPDDRNLFLELADAPTVTDVDRVWESALGVGIRETPSVAAGRSPLDPRSLGYQFRRATKDARLLGMTPSRFLHFDNLDETVETLDRYMLNSRIGEARRDEILDGYMRGYSSRTSRYQTIATTMDAVSESMIAAGAPADEARRLTRFVRRDGETGRMFVVGQVADGPATFDGLVHNGELIDFRYHPHDINETFNTGVMLPDPRSVRRATSKYAPLFNHKLVKAGTSLGDQYMGMWRRGKLARPAWGVRVIGEEQARIAAVGLQGVYNHPVSALAWTISTPDSKLADMLDRLDRGFAGTPIGAKQKQRLTADELDELEAAIDATEAVTREPGLLGKAAKKVRTFKTEHGRGAFLPNGEPFADDTTVLQQLNNVGDIYRRHQDYRYLKAFDVVDRSMEEWDDLAARGLGEDYNRLSSSTMRTVIDADSPDAAKAWFWEGDGARVRLELAKENKLAPLENNRAFSDAYIDSEYERLADLTGGDERLREGLRRGRIENVRLYDGYGQLTGKGEAKIKAILDEGAGPQRVKVQRRERVGADQLKEDRLHLDRALDSMFEAIMPVPSNYFDRLPTIKQKVWQRTEELMPYVEGDARVKVLKSAEESNLDAKTLARMKATKPVKGKPEMMLDADQVTLASVSYGADELKKLLYDLSERSQFFDVFRLIFPFGEAWKEVASRWARISYEQPQVLRRVQQGVQGARGAGFFHQDENGQEVFSIPFTGWLTEHVPPAAQAAIGGAAMGAAAGGLPGAVAGAAIAGGGTAALVGTEAAGVPLPMSASVGGLNMVSTGLPGVGPVAQIPLSRLIPNTPNWEWARKVLYPFGEPEETGSPLYNVIEEGAPFPSWATKAIDALQNPDRFRMQGNTVGWVMRYKRSTGDYKLKGDKAASELRRLEEDSIEAAKKLGLIRALVAGIAPSAPLPDWQVEDKDGTLVEAHVLVEEYRNLMEPEEKGGRGLDYDQALEVFVDRHGIDNILVTQAFSEPIHGYVPPTDAATDWVSENPKLAKRFPDVFGLFAPGQDDEFSLDAYSAQFTRGERRALTPREMLEQANHRIASNIYRREEEAELNADGELDADSRDYLRGLRNALKREYAGFRKEGFDYERIPNLILDLERAARSTLMKGEKGTAALKTYLKERAAEVEAAEGGSLGGVDDADARDYLRGLGRQLSRENPAFLPFWQSVFEVELRLGD
jgi:hypothetical protein